MKSRLCQFLSIFDKSSACFLLIPASFLSFLDVFLSSSLSWVNRNKSFVTSRWSKHVSMTSKWISRAPRGSLIFYTEYDRWCSHSLFTTLTSYLIFTDSLCNRDSGPCCVVDGWATKSLTEDRWIQISPRSRKEKEKLIDDHTCYQTTWSLKWDWKSSLIQYLEINESVWR